MEYATSQSLLDDEYYELKAEYIGQIQKYMNLKKTLRLPWK